MSSEEAGAASAQAAQLATLPVELILQVVEARLAQVDEQLQSDIVSLRLTSKLLHKSATTHFYKVIQLRNPSHIMDLIAQLQAKSELCSTTRAVWWSEDEGRKVHMESAERFLVILANVDEVAFWRSLHSKRGNKCPVGVHYALRDVGPWCQLEDLDLSRDSVGKIQGTPTLKLVHSPGSEEDLASRLGWSLQLQQKTSDPQPSTEGPGANRAVWALHVAVSQGVELGGLESLWLQYPTITHLTITLSRSDFQRDTLEANIRRILGSTLQLLQYLVIRVVCAKGLLNVALPMLFRDPRICVKKIELSEPSMPQDAMRVFTLQGWQERVFHNGHGPWQDPLTEIVGPRYPSPEPPYYDHYDHSNDSEDDYDDYDDYDDDDDGRYNSYEGDDGWDPIYYH